jgi:uncharacterized protein (TIGR02597 family)
VLLSFPFKRSASFRGKVVSVAGSEITVKADSLAGEDFSTSAYYIFVEEVVAEVSVMEGRRIDVVSNTVSTIDLGGADLTGLAVEDVISVREHWTLDEAFPQGFGSVVETDPGLRQIELIVPDVASVGGGLAVNRLFYFYAGQWKELGKPLGDDAGSTVLFPGEPIVVRNNHLIDGVKSYFFGEVIDAPIAISIVSDQSVVAADVDNFVSLERPLALHLDELLGIADVLESGDALLVYPLDGGKNPSPVAYEYESSQWQIVDTSVNIGSHDDHIIQPEQGIAIRRASVNGDGQWINNWDLPTL